MQHFRVHPPVWLLPLAICAVALTATAQSIAPASRKPDPLDAKAAVPGVAYESTFSRNRRKADEQPITWREANDTVARIGGWRAYAREAQQAEPAPPAAPASASPASSKPMPMPMPQGHHGHKQP